MTLKSLIFLIIKVAITIVVVIAAVLLTKALWYRYMDSSWTRDGRVRADIITIAPDVSGLVTEVMVKDNQFVHKGDVLMRIDPERYTLALRQAEATAEQQKVALDNRLREARRRATLDSDVITKEAVDTVNTSAAQASAAYQSSLAARDLARLNLQRTELHASVDGWVVNVTVRPGDYAQAGAAKMALVDAASFWVYGYFEENKIRLIRTGDRADIHLLGGDQLIQGHVEGIARGITDRDNAGVTGQLANVNPSFNWVRLAQRIPVRIAIDKIPPGVLLSAGMTCYIQTYPTASRHEGEQGPVVVSPSGQTATAPH